MAKVTGKALYEALRAAYSPSGAPVKDQDIATTLGLDVADFRRLKSQTDELVGPRVMKWIELLDVVGWINPKIELDPAEVMRRARIYRKSRA